MRYNARLPARFSNRHARCPCLAVRKVACCHYVRGKPLKHVQQTILQVPPVTRHPSTEGKGRGEGTVVREISSPDVIESCATCRRARVPSCSRLTLLIKLILT